MKLRSFFYTLATIVVVLLLLGAGGAYWLAAHSPLTLLREGDIANPAAAMFVSRQSPAMLSLLVNPERLESFWLAKAEPRKRRSVQAELNRLQRSVWADTPLNYDQDVKPWLGNELTFAVTSTDVDRDSSNGKQPGYLMVLEAAKPELAQESLQSFWQQRAARGMKLVFEPFAGVQLVHATQAQASERDDLPPALTSAVVGNYVLFANSPKVLRDAINNAQVTDLNLSQNAAYQQALERLEGQRLGLVFVNLPQFAAWLADQPNLPRQPQTSPLFSKDSPYEALIATLEPNRHGILAEAVLLPAEGQSLEPSTPVLSAPVDALRFVPPTSTLVAAGQDLPQTWRSLEANLAAYEPFQTLVQRPLSDLEQQWQLTLSEDLFPWMPGEYALAQVPRSDHSRSDWLFVVQDSPDSAAGLAHLDALAQQQGVSVGSFPFKDATLFAWTKLTTRNRAQSGVASLQAEVQGVRTHRDGYTLFATSLEAIEQALQAPSTESTEFQQAVATLRFPNNGYFYLDRSTLRRLLQQESLAALSHLPKPFLDSLQSVMISSYGTGKDGSQGAVFLRLNGI
ncbi:MAG: DUF3352 domain-containing protein [Synechococcales cyanobacterium C42_A2020_086]|jgi:hypothetical protein|nr:DUF3352 domain-containing protein [Synechococcales cyanobacterium C42_A2020_086]